MIDTFFFNLWRQVPTSLQAYNLTELTDEYTSIVEPVSLNDLALYCRIDQTYDQSLVQMLGLAARVTFETLARIKVMQTSYQVDYDGFNDMGLKLPRRPVQSITSVTYQDQNNQTQTLAQNTGWLLDKKAIYSRIVPPQTTVFPVTYIGPNTVSVQFTAGISANDPTHVPAPIKTAILLLANHFYMNREAISQGQTVAMPFALDALISLYDAPEI